MDSINKYISVSVFTDLLKNTLEKTFYDTIYLKGEISGFRPSSTGHWYFTIKDEEAVISAVIFKGSQSAIYEDFKSKGILQIKDGQEVVIEGKINLYKKGGSYSIIINKMKPLGLGELFYKFEELKRTLSEKGYFDSSRKKALPNHPAVVGIVTSPTGAALQDMLNVLNRRAAGITVKIFPVSVQGDNAKYEISNAVKYASYHYSNNGKDKVDVLIIARGGGSIEDLWAFNELIVADAINECSVPVISGIGHEIDFTIADFCADLRAPTPSAAAELLSKSSEELSSNLASLTLRIEGAIDTKIKNYRYRCESFSKEKLERAVKRIYESKLQDHSYISEKFIQSYKNGLNLIKHSLEVKNKRLNALNPFNILERGYSVIYNSGNNKVIGSINNAEINDKIKIIMKDGSLESIITGKKEKTSP